MELDAFMEYVAETYSKKDNSSDYLGNGVGGSNDETYGSRVKYLVFKPTINMVDPKFIVRIEFSSRNVLKETCRRHGILHKKRI